MGHVRAQACGTDYLIQALTPDRGGIPGFSPCLALIGRRCHAGRPASVGVGRRLQGIHARDPPPWRRLLHDVHAQGGAKWGRPDGYGECFRLEIRASSYTSFKFEAASVKERRRKDGSFEILEWGGGRAWRLAPFRGCSLASFVAGAWEFRWMKRRLEAGVSGRMPFPRRSSGRPRMLGPVLP